MSRLLSSGIPPGRVGSGRPASIVIQPTITLLVAGPDRNEIMNDELAKHPGCRRKERKATRMTNNDRYQEKEEKKAQKAERYTRIDRLD